MKELNNILLVSGSGRNSGKTTFACHAISQLAKTEKVIGLKISPHFHFVEKKQTLVFEGEGFQVFQENDWNSSKDSSKMLRAGASEVYFIQSGDIDLEKLWEWVEKNIPGNIPVVCESGSFAEKFQPGFQILVVGEEPDLSKKSYLLNMEKADFIVKKEEFSPEYFGFEIHFRNEKWVLKKLKNDKFRRSA